MNIWFGVILNLFLNANLNHKGYQYFGKLTDFVFWTYVNQGGKACIGGRAPTCCPGRGAGFGSQDQYPPLAFVGAPDTHVVCRYTYR